MTTPSEACRNLAALMEAVASSMGSGFALRAVVRNTFMLSAPPNPDGSRDLFVVEVRHFTTTPHRPKDATHE